MAEQRYLVRVKFNNLLKYIILQETELTVAAFLEKGNYKSFENCELQKKNSNLCMNFTSSCKSIWY